MPANLSAQAYTLPSPERNPSPQPASLGCPTIFPPGLISPNPPCAPDLFENRPATFFITTLFTFSYLRVILVDVMYSKIKVVCFGGGTGLPVLLSGLKHNPWLEITAVVNMFDTGGSSGELRDRFGILPPGDVLRCLLALSEDEVYARELLQRRIRNNNSPGHTGGNVLLLGLEKVYGDYLAAVDALGQLLSIRGKVVPVTLAQSTLCARYEDGSVARGETNVDKGIDGGKKVAEIFLDPAVPASEQALKAIAEADVFCIGPGSFYTSVLSNFLPNGVKEAIQNSSGKIIYIANLFTEGEGMRSADVVDFVATLEKHIGRAADWIVLDNGVVRNYDFVLKKYAAEGKHPVENKRGIGKRYVSGDLWTDPEIGRHDRSRLAHLVTDLINRANAEL